MMLPVAAHRLAADPALRRFDRASDLIDDFVPSGCINGMSGRVSALLPDVLSRLPF
jgi:hypothetical protein